MSVVLIQLVLQEYLKHVVGSINNMLLVQEAVVFFNMLFLQFVLYCFFPLPLIYDLLFLLLYQFSSSVFLRVRGVHWENAIKFSFSRFALITIVSLAGLWTKFLI